MIYTTIFGERIEGEIVATKTNVVIIEDAQCCRHVVHKESMMKNHQRVRADACVEEGFDLAECQTIGRKQYLFRRARHM